MHPPHTVGIAWYEAGAVRHSPTVERRRYRRRAPAPGTPRAASAPPYRPAAPRRRACGTCVNRPIHADLPRVLGLPESVEQSHTILLGGLPVGVCARSRHNQTISRRPAPNTVVHPHTDPRTKSTRSYHGVNTHWNEGIMERIEELSFDGIARGIPHHGNDVPRRPAPPVANRSGDRPDDIAVGVRRRVGVLDVGSPLAAGSGPSERRDVQGPRRYDAGRVAGRQQRLGHKPGRLLAITGDVVDERGGEPMTVTFNGSPVTAESFDGRRCPSRLR